MTSNVVIFLVFWGGGGMEFLCSHSLLNPQTSWSWVHDSLESHRFFSSLHCRRFEESHVAQIKTVFPDAYTFRQEKDVPTFTSSVKKGSYQLTVEPIISAGEVTAHSWPFGACILCMCPPHLTFLTSVLRPE